MESLFLLPNQHFQIHYDFFYGLAFLVTFLLLIYQAYKMKLQKFQWLQWLLIIASVRMFFIIGTKLVTFSGQDWIYFFNTLQFPATESKSVFGGLLLALIGFGIAKIWLRYRFKVFDAFAIVIPIGMAIQRVGCLLVGCCYGNTTMLPWGVHYGNFSPAYHHQVHSGLIDPSASHSLGVHPIPLYVILYCLLIAFIVWKNKNRFKSSGNLILFTVSLLFTAGFFVEFLRHPSTNGTLANQFMGLKLIQWSLLALVVMLILIMLVKEVRHKDVLRAKIKILVNYSATISFICFLSLILYRGRDWFIPIEKISLLLIILPVVIVLLWQLNHQVQKMEYKLTATALVLLSFVFMAQTVEFSENDSTDQFVPMAWNSIALGYGVGSYENIDYGCEGEVLNRTKHTYNIGRAEYNRHFSLEENEVGTFGLRGYYGRDLNSRNLEFFDSEQTIYGVNPYFMYDFRKIGLGVGFHYGRLPYRDENYSRETNFLPMFYFRAWPKDKVYAELYIYDHSMLYTPISAFRVGLGFNLGNETNSLHLGFAEANGQNSLYLNSRFLISDNFSLDPNISFQITDSKGFQGGVGLHYVFGRSPVNGKKK